MYTIEKLNRNDTDFDKSDIEMYRILFQFEKRNAEVLITLQTPDKKIFPKSKEDGKMFYISSKTDGYHWLNFWLAQEPGATSLICERDEIKAILVSYTGIRFPWEFQGDRQPSYKLKDLSLGGITAYNSMRISTLKVALLFEAFGFEYENEDKEACFLYYSGQEEASVIMERMCSIIEPRFALAEKFFPE